VEELHETSWARLELEDEAFRAVQEAAVTARWSIRDPEWNEYLQAYFETTLGDAVVSIAKGWRDPGFRVFADVDLPRVSTSHPLTFGMIADHCAIQGIALSRSDAGSDVWVAETVIYTSGFNADSFLETINTFFACLESLDTLCNSLVGCRSIEFADA
jgi:hypothetical protein